MVRLFLTSDTLQGVFTYKDNSAVSPGILIGQLAGVYYWFNDSINPGNNLTMTAAEFKRYFPVGQWIELAWLITSTTVSLWSNHVLVKNAAPLGVSLNTGALDFIFWGKSQTAANADLYPYGGFFKDGLIGNGNLTQAEVDDFFYDGIVPSTATDRWGMGEGTGTDVANSITAGNNLTTTNITWSTKVPMQERTATTQERQHILTTPFSMVGVASTTSGLTVPNHASLNPTAAVTLIIRFRLSGPNTYHLLFDNSEVGATNSYYFDYYEGLGFRWYSVIGGVSRNITTTTYRIPKDNAWHTAIATFTGTQINIFVDGVKLPEEITGLSGALGVNTGVLRIGRTWNALAAGALTGYFHRPIICAAGCTLQEAKDFTFEGKLSSALQAARVLDIPTTEGSGTSPADASPYAHTVTMGAAMSWSSTIVPFYARSELSQARTDI